MTALHYAVTCDQQDIVKALVEAGADPLAMDNDGNQALQGASDELKAFILQLRPEISTGDKVQQRPRELGAAEEAELRALLDEQRRPEEETDAEWQVNHHKRATAPPQPASDDEFAQANQRENLPPLAWAKQQISNASQ